MKIIGIIILLSGVFFVLYTFLSEPTQETTTQNWGIWIGLLVLLTGGVITYSARNEE